MVERRCVHVANQRKSGNTFRLPPGVLHAAGDQNGGVMEYWLLALLKACEEMQLVSVYGAF